ncbi:hypothetical protein BGZ83_002028, partial [Gryganskiella cystojenkinii]
VTYFHCRPKCGIFVLAAKIVKSELLFPSSLEPATATVTSTPASQRPPSVQEDIAGPLPHVNNHAAQAASRITAGSRASKYVGVTASQLKQRQGTATTTATSTSSTPSRLSIQSQVNIPGSSMRASSPTIRALSGMAGSPTSTRTLASGTTNGRANSPSPVPKPLLRASSPTTRTGLSATRQPLPTTNKPTLGTTANKSGGAHSRSTSSTSSVSSQSSATGTTTRARTSPTPRNNLTTPRRLSSRSDTPDVSTILSPSESRSNLLDQATVIQMASSPQHDDAVQQLQQLRLDYGVVVAENSLLKSEVQQGSKSRLEGVDERILNELEELQTMKIVWEKERAAKDQEIKVVTDKMTQAWLEAARSQKERTTLIQDKADLNEKLKLLRESNGMAESDAETLTQIESLQEKLRFTEEMSQVLEAKIQDLESKALEQDEKLAKATEESRISSSAKQLELEHERDALKVQLSVLEATSESTMAEKETLLQAALEDTAQIKSQLEHVQNKVKLESDESVAKLEQSEAALRLAQEHVAKNEKTIRGFEEKTKEYDSTIAKRDQEIANFKLELQDLAGMVQSEEVDRMRKVWENEKKRLEEAVTDNIIIMTTLRSEIQTLESSEDEFMDKIKTLEATIASLTETKTAAEAESVRLQKSLEDTEAKLSVAEADMTSRLAETKERMEKLEEIALTVEEWQERCEAMQLEVIQKAALLEESVFNGEELQSFLNLANQANEVLKKDLERKHALLVPLDTLEASRAEVSALEEEREDLLAKIAELEAALTLSASVPTTTSSGDNTVVLNREELEEEITGLKAMVHELTAENATVAGENKKLMQEHDILMEAHKHVETECLKLMDEVERLHSESLAVSNGDDASSGEKDELDLLDHGAGHKAVVIVQDDLKAALNNLTAITKDTTIVTATEKQANGGTGTNQSASVIRLEGLLKEKQSLLDRLTQAHALEMRDLRQRYVELDRSKSWEIAQQNKELTELESLIESKIFHEADLEEDVQQKQKQIDRLQREVSDLRSQLSKLSNGALGGSGSSDLPPTPTTSSAPSMYSGLNGYGSRESNGERTRTTTDSTADQALYCEICEVEGHDLISCVAVFGGNKSGAVSASTAAAASAAVSGTGRSESATEPSSTFSKDLEDERAYCENCEEFGLHYTDECPNESLTY